MRIKRFNENTETVDISSERCEEISKELKEMTASLDDKRKKVESLINELNGFRNNSQKGNDQIDDSLYALQILEKNFSDSVDKLDTIIMNLSNYNEEGRKYLYTENK
jgi:ABC-type transporter Mla subunit MlaD